MNPKNQKAAMINVLVVEDSPVSQEQLVFLLEQDPMIRVIGTVSSGEDALKFVRKTPPTVILMDIHLPGIDGFEATRQIMATVPVPIVICTSSATFDAVKMAMHAVEAGALAAVQKPRGPADPASDATAAELVQVLRLMSEVKVVRRWKRVPPAPQPKIPSPMAPLAGEPWTLVAMGASTGGPPAIVEILKALEPDFPLPILLVQHISAGFTHGFAEWLEAASNIPVRIARAGEIPLPGHVYVAPDGFHLTVGDQGELATIVGESHHGLRPSVGVLFKSLARKFGPRVIAILLTGMGRDGAEELKILADQGALTIAQNEESSVVFGMPGEAIRLGAARYISTPAGIAELLNKSVQGNGKKDQP